MPNFLKNLVESYMGRASTPEERYVKESLRKYLEYLDNIEQLQYGILDRVCSEEAWRADAEATHLMSKAFEKEMRSPAYCNIAQPPHMQHAYKVSMQRAHEVSACSAERYIWEMRMALKNKRDLEHKLLQCTNDTRAFLKQFVKAVDTYKEKELARIQLRRECLEEKLREYEDNSAQMLRIQSAIMECNKEQEAVHINTAQAHEACARQEKELHINAEKAQAERQNLDKGLDVKYIIESQAHCEKSLIIEAERVALKRRGLLERLSRYKEDMLQCSSYLQDKSLTAALLKECGNIANNLREAISSLEDEMVACTDKEASIYSDAATKRAISRTIMAGLHKEGECGRIIDSRNDRAYQLRSRITVLYSNLHAPTQDHTMGTPTITPAEHRALSARIEARRGRGTAPMIRDKDDLGSFKTAIFAECDRQFLEGSLHHIEIGSAPPPLQRDIDQAQSDIELCKQEEKELKRFYRAEKERRDKESTGVYSTNRAANLEGDEKLENFLAHRRWLDNVNVKKTEQHQHDEREARILARRTLGMASTISDAGFSNTAVFAERDRQSLAEDLLHLERRLANCMVSDVNGPQLQHEIDQLQSDIELCEHEERELKRFHGTKREQPGKEKVEEASTGNENSASADTRAASMLSDTQASNDHCVQVHSVEPNTAVFTARDRQSLAKDLLHLERRLVNCMVSDVSGPPLQHEIDQWQHEIDKVQSDIALCKHEERELRRFHGTKKEQPGKEKVEEASTGNENSASADTAEQNDVRAASMLSDTQASNDHCVQVHSVEPISNNKRCCIII